MKYVIKGVTISVYCDIILPMQYTGTLNEDTSIPLYNSFPVFYTRISCLANRTHCKIDCALSSLPVFTFPGIILLESVRLQTCIFQHGRLRLRFQFGESSIYDLIQV